jgi:dTDP-4-amino-4,6-dideoxygalactose transaminase
MADWRIPLCGLSFDAQERQAVDEVLASGWLTMGPLTERFEREAADYLGVPGALLVSSGTAALHLALMALDPEPGRACVVPAITFAAGANVPALLGLNVLLCDIESPDRPTLSRSGLAEILTQRPNVIVCPMHYGGYEADVWDVLRDFPQADIMEDAAHALGGFDAAGGRLGACGLSAKVGSGRALGCFSFFSNKNLATGEGGLVVSRDPELLRRARLARSHGVTRPTWERHARRPGSETVFDPEGRTLDYDVVSPGWNYRPTEIVAALALARLPKLDARNARRRELVARYREGLAPAGVAMPFSPEEDARSAAHLAPALFPSASAAEDARRALAEAGIQTSRHYAALHRLGWLRDRRGPDAPPFPNAEAFAARELTLPLFPEMRIAEADEVVEIIKKSMLAAERV